MGNVERPVTDEWPILTSANELEGALSHRIVSVVPFAEDARAIAVSFETFGDGGFLQLQFPTDFGRGAHADRMAAGQQHRPRRRENAPAHERRQFHAAGNQCER